MNNNDIYKRALCKIEKYGPLYPQCCCCFGSTGPTGPTGPAGPATITVGTTTTGEAGTQATVTNAGTTSDVILDFAIPQGPTGPTGATGPAGSTGPTGATPTIDSILVDNDGTQTVTADSLLNLGSVINTTGTSITFTAPNTVNLTVPGTYLILFETLASNTSTTGDLGASMLINGVIASNASEYVPGTSVQSQFVLQHNVTIGSNTTVTIQNNSTVSNDYHDSSLSIIKLG